MISDQLKNFRSRAQIVATLGPVSGTLKNIVALAQAGMDVARMNFSWGSYPEHIERIKSIRQAEKDSGREIIIIQDLPGPRIQESTSHTYDHAAIKALTDKDREYIKFGIEHNVDYIAVSFVGSASDIEDCRSCIKENGGKQRIIAKIERSLALQNLDGIVKSADAVMVARGDLGSEVPLEKIPFVQEDIVSATNKAGKPVIVATQMMLSMTEHPIPTRAEVTDVEVAILEGADAVMLSEETASGKFPLEAVTMMEKSVSEAEKHVSRERVFNLLKRLS